MKRTHWAYSRCFFSGSFGIIYFWCCCWLNICYFVLLIASFSFHHFDILITIVCMWYLFCWDFLEKNFEQLVLNLITFVWFTLLLLFWVALSKKNPGKKIMSKFALRYDYNTYFKQYSRTQKNYHDRIFPLLNRLFDRSNRWLLNV